MLRLADFHLFDWVAPQRLAVIGFRERVATHEAGHCVAALTYGIPLVHVSIVGHPHAQCANYRPPQGLACEALLTFYLAGSGAEKEFCGASDHGGDRIDVDNARRYLARRFAPLQVGFQLVRYRDAAQRLVQSAWARQRIRVLAEALLSHGTLTGEQIAALLDGSTEFAVPGAVT